MDFSAIPLFNIMKSKLDYVSERQAVLAQNIANADTPNYKAKDIAPPDFKNLLNASGGGSVRKLQMTTTSPQHIGHGAMAMSSLRIIERKSTMELNPNGNNVTIEDEMAKVADNQAEYQKTLNLYSKAISMFKAAIGSPSTG